MIGRPNTALRTPPTGAASPVMAQVRSVAWTCIGRCGRSRSPATWSQCRCVGSAKSRRSAEMPACSSDVDKSSTSEGGLTATRSASGNSAIARSFTCADPSRSSGTLGHARASGRPEVKREAMTDGLRIGDAAAMLGLDSHVLRHWEEMGLLRPPRSSSGHRVYDDELVTRARLIRVCQRAGMSLAEIRALGTAGMARRVELVAAKRAEIQAAVEQLHRGGRVPRAPTRLPTPNRLGMRGVLRLRCIPVAAFSTRTSRDAAQAGKPAAL